MYWAKPQVYMYKCNCRPCGSCSCAQLAHQQLIVGFIIISVQMGADAGVHEACGLAIELYML